MTEQKSWKGKKEESKQEWRISTEEPTIPIVTATRCNLELRKIVNKMWKVLNFLKMLGKYHLFLTSQWKVKEIEKKKYTGGSLPTGSNTRWSYFRRTLYILVSFFNQYKTFFQEISTTSKVVTNIVLSFATRREKLEKSQLCT